jgi:hypothetical protein
MSEVGRRSTKALTVTTELNRRQREWFATVRERAADRPIALVNADAPHEVFRAAGIDYVVVQWWSSLLSAKQRASASLSTLRERGYPDDDEQYSALGLGEMLSGAGDQPWGGLPSPAILSGVVTTDSSARVLEAWAREAGCICYLFESTVDPRLDIQSQWWDRLAHEWPTVLDPDRVNLMVAELEDLIGILDRRVGASFSVDRLAEVMALANEQLEYYRRTRDLIARSVPAPVSVVDTMPATMISQWHRGSTVGRDAAKALYEEVRARVEAGQAACADEQIRLMWLGRGLWSDMALYQHFEAEFGAVFVWSMYLSLAADGYLRYGEEPLRTLASRFVPLIEILRMPTWSSAWHCKEAELHQIDGVISLGEEDYFSARVLEARGIPVLRIGATNVDPSTWSRQGLVDQISRFLDHEVVPKAARRRGSSA